MAIKIIKKITCFCVLSAIGLGFVTFASSNKVSASKAAEKIELKAYEGDTDYRPTQIVNGDFTEMPWNNYKKNSTTYTKENYYKDGSSPSSGFTPIYSLNNWNTTETSVWRSSLFEWLTYSEDTTVRPFVYFINKAKQSSNKPYNQVISNEFKAGLNVGCIEMNATNQAVFYQDLPTTSLDVIRWSLDHAVRTDDGSSTQTLHVEIGPTPTSGTDGSVVQATGTNSKIDSSKVVKYSYNGVTGDSRVADAGNLSNLRLSQSSQANGWYNSNGVYIVPLGQKLTRFAFISDTNSSTGNLLDNIVFSTLIGNLQAIKDDDGNLIVTGYWGEHDPNKKLEIDVGDETIEVDMTSVCEKNFTLTIPKEYVGENKKISVYHEDYPGAASEVHVTHKHTWNYVANGATLTAYCSNTEEAEGCRYQGQANSVSITVKAENQQYNGSPYTGADYVDTGAWSQSMQEVPLIYYVGRDSTIYEESLIPPTNAGKYSAELIRGSQKAKADFEITKITIDPTKLTISPIEDQAFTGLPVTPVPTITYGELTLVKDVDFKIEYENNVNIGTASYKITFLTNFEGDQQTGTFEIVDQEIPGLDVVLDSDTFEFTGNEIKPGVTVTKYGSILQEGTDYDVTYSNNVNVGTGTVTITLKGDYSGTTTRNFTITPIGDIDESDVTLPFDEYTYTGEQITPIPTIVIDGVTLVEGIDYDVEYGDNTNVGEGTVKITFKGNYTGEVTKTFDIVAPSVDVIDVSIPSDSFEYTGTQIKPEVTVEYNGTGLIEGEDYEVTYGDNVDAGEDAGYILVTFKNNFDGEKELYFDIVPKGKEDLDVELPGGTNYPYDNGNEIKPEIIIKDGGKVLEEGTDYIVTYTDNTAPGTGNIHIEMIGNYSGEFDQEFTIDKGSSEDVEATMDEESFVYTGEDITPKPTIMYKGEELVEGEDYDLVYEDNKDVGTGTVTIVFKGNFEGEIEKTFEITKPSKDDVDVSLPQSTYPYTGEQIKPIPTVEYNGKTLLEGVDYDVTYGTNKDVGTGTVTITLKGNFEGTIVEEFLIGKKPATSLDISLEEDSYEYTGRQITPKPIIKDGEEVLVEGVDYLLTYGENINAGEDAGSIYIEFIDRYEGDSTVLFDITKKDASDTVEPELPGGDEYEYTGEAIEPEVILKDGDKTLEEGVDYIVEYENNEEPGTGTIHITFIGNYEGEMDMDFEIKPASSSNVSMHIDKNIYDYTGGEIQPNETLTYNGKTLTKGVDYDITYEDNIEVGTGKVVATLKGNYKGTITKTFSINPRDVSDDVNVSLPDGTKYSYTGDQIRPKVNVTVDGETLTEGVDYTISYSNNTESGTGLVIVSFMGNYKGKANAKFTIGPSMDIAHIIIAYTGIIYAIIMLVLFLKTKERKIDKTIVLITVGYAAITIIAAVFGVTYLTWVTLGINVVIGAAFLLNFAFNK